MTSQSRIRLARRHAGLSQVKLAQAVGVQRSAVSHWESAQGKNPTLCHLREIALVTGVHFEWLATGRGQIALCNEVRMDSIPAAQALLIHDALELRLLEAFRDISMQSQLPLVEIAEQMAARIGRKQRSPESLDQTPQHDIEVGLRSVRWAGTPT